MPKDARAVPNPDRAAATWAVVAKLSQDPIGQRAREALVAILWATAIVGGLLAAGALVGRLIRTANGPVVKQ